MLDAYCFIVVICIQYQMVGVWHVRMGMRLSNLNSPSPIFPRGKRTFVVRLECLENDTFVINEIK